MADCTIDLLKQSAPIFAMLQDENRQNILMMLCRHRELTVNQITEQLQLSRPAVSHHLKLLLDADLLSVRREGTERYYQIHLEDALSLLEALTASLKDTLAHGLQA